MSPSTCTDWSRVKAASATASASSEVMVARGGARPQTRTPPRVLARSSAALGVSREAIHRSCRSARRWLKHHRPEVLLQLFDGAAERIDVARQVVDGGQSVEDAAGVARGEHGADGR